MPELGVYGATDSVYGVTRNPWNPELTPGGSSGGSAAAVAAAEVPIAHANDGLGSIRIPAACTGLFGLKPGLGVVPAQIGTTDWYAMAENGPLATTVADAAVMLAVMADRPALASVEALDGRIRVAVSMRSPVIGTRLDPQWREAADDVARILSRAGHDVRRADPSYPQGAAVAGLARWFAGTAGDAAALDAGRLEPRVRTHARIGRVVRATPLMADRLRATWCAVATKFLTTYDVLVTPALAQPPIAARDWGRGSWRATMLANVAYAPFAGAWNLAGFPAASVPMGVHPVSGTPVAAQLVAAPGREDLLLATAALIERERPWQRVAPNYA
jgi:amidase